MRFRMKLHAIAVAPISILFILSSAKIHPTYRMTLTRRLRLGLKMLFNNLRIPTGTSFKAHLAMALKILETPRKRKGTSSSAALGKVDPPRICR